MWAIASFLTELSYALSTVLIKWSMLALYWRIFSIEASIKPLIWILFGMVCSWGVASVWLDRLRIRQYADFC